MSLTDRGVDFGKTAADYRRHRLGFPAELFARLEPLGVGLPGQRVLDLGTGTGSLGRGLARRGARVTGLDLARPLLGQARDLDREADVASTYVLGRAEAPPLAEGAWDVVAAGQCWHWFDRPRAAAAARRLLRPGGSLLVAHFDWLPLPGNVVAATEELILRHNPAWRGAGGTGVYPQWLGDAALAGFVGIETFTFDVPTTYTHEAWRGRIRASAGVAASLPPAAVARFDADLAALLAERFAEEPLATPHRIFALVARAPTPRRRATPGAPRGR